MANVLTKCVSENPALKEFLLPKTILKLNAIVLTRSHELQKIKINVVAGAVEEVNQVKYLGVLIDNQWKWRQQLDYVCIKLACASYALLKLRAFSPISTQNCLLCSSSSTSFIWTGLLE